jgi:glycine/D-amino acid oxidase-like deaminating enzyme
MINPRALHHLLCACLVHHQIDLLDANLLSVQERGEDFLLTLDTSQTRLSPRVIIAAGAWSFEVAALFHLNVPVSPARGQLIHLSGVPGLLQHILYMPAGACGCLLERAPGRYIAGTSEEHLSAEVCNTSKVVAAILTRINHVFLPAGDFVIDEMWSGFRSITPDELPIIGVSPDPRIIVATGHYRNGVLLSPLTGLLIRSLLDGETLNICLDPYQYQRAYPAPYRFASAY